MAVKAPVQAPPIPTYTWTGCYVGANLGAAWSTNRFDDRFGRSEASYTSSGFAGGGQIGCDYQFAGNWVIGIQGMWDATSIKTPGPSTLNLANSLDTQVNSFATVTARLGFLVVPSVLLYGKGGVGFIDDRFTCVGAMGGPCMAQSGGLGFLVKNTRDGYDVGGGLAWMFAPNWDLWAEYDHIGTGSKTLTFVSQSGNGIVFNEVVSQKLDKVLVGVDYRFSFGGAPVVAKY
jgi:outer membrane immunogenic protein